MLSAEQIQKNYEKHLNIINHYIGDRKDSILSMLEHMQETYVMAPASGRTCSTRGAASTRWLLPSTLSAASRSSRPSDCCSGR